MREQALVSVAQPQPEVQPWPFPASQWAAGGESLAIYRHASAWPSQGGSAWEQAIVKSSSEGDKQTERQHASVSLSLAIFYLGAQSLAGVLTRPFNEPMAQLMQK